MASNFNNTTPAAPAGGVNVLWQTDGSGNDSAYIAAGGFAPVYAGADGGFFGGFVNPFIPSGSIMTNAGPSASPNSVHAMLFSLPFPITINKVVYWVISNSSDLWGFGIYSSDGLTKLVDTGALSTVTGTGAASVTLGSPVTLPAGEYFFAETSSGTTSNSAYYNLEATYTIPMQNFNRNRAGVAANASVSGVLPATLGAITTSGQRDPILAWFEN